ncbi:MAG: hypothetical protein IT176_03710 [Acidobacteria bacterium]|nr:hypothetical protein [Acidobacteriota bacterium]
MGRKSSAKQQQQGAPRCPVEAKRSSPRMAALILVVVAAIAAVFFLRQGTEPDAVAAQAAAVPPQNQQPHEQAVLPPLDIPAEYTPRPPDVIRAAYTFAAEHPEVLSYVPCFCGCEAAGHKGNHDCFVRERAANGDVVAWDEHGTECTVCIDVATRARQLFAEGKSVPEIRATVEKDYAGAASHTPTPDPPQ